MTLYTKQPFPTFGVRFLFLGSQARLAKRGRQISYSKSPEYFSIYLLSFSEAVRLYDVR
jgi:hypothetical protein